ncbi:uncharacterized protein LOC135389729 [Ornithodoros turicata]|uniref:uncharacterized protein LOC135389729 n=1 Tax=Ornithodoros turicata TaxID=34597 RepID=UPI003138CF36
MAPATPRGGTQCCIPSCRHNSARHRDVSFHCFPKDTATRDLWVQALVENTTVPASWKPGLSHRICGAHFNVLGKRKYMDKVPWLLKPGTFIQTTHQTCCSVNEEPSLLEVADETTVETSFEGLSSTDVSCSEQESSFSVSHHGYDAAEESKIREELALLSKENQELRKLNSRLLQEKSDAENASAKRLEAYTREVQDLEQKLCAAQVDRQKLQSHIQELQRRLQRHEHSERHLPKPTPSDVLKDSDKLRFYTGFTTHERFKTFCEFVRAGHEDYKKLSSKAGSNKGRPPLFSLEEQLALVLTRLRVGLLEQDLAYRYSTSVAYISELCSFWVEFLCEYLDKTPIWPSRDIVDEFMPEVFRESYPSTRVILDCTELYIETPSDFRVQSDTYSTYKSHNTAKGLIGIAPNGFVTFVSDLAPGRISDKALVRQSGLYKLLEEGDAVMADRGFLIKEDLADLKVDLNIPPFLNGASQLSLADESTTRAIAKARIHVERVIRQVTLFLTESRMLLCCNRA